MQLWEKGQKYSLAVGIILASFIVIGAMLGLQQLTMERFINPDILKTFNDTQKENMLKTITESNERVFSILLPVFAAWVGAVIAAYFTSTRNNQDHSNKDDNENEKNTASKKKSDLSDGEQEIIKPEFVDIDQLRKKLIDNESKFNSDNIDESNKQLDMILHKLHMLDEFEHERLSHLQTDDNPIDILKIRFAKGEISEKAYEKMKSTLK